MHRFYFVIWQTKKTIQQKFTNFYCKNYDVMPAVCGPSRQWQRYTRVHQVKWPGWKIHRPGSTQPIALVTVWTENKNVTISDCWPLYLDSETISAALAAFVFWGRWLKKGHRLFEKKRIRVTWLEDVLASKWPGSFAALAPSLYPHGSARCTLDLNKLSTHSISGWPLFSNATNGYR